ARSNSRPTTNAVVIPVASTMNTMVASRDLVSFPAGAALPVITLGESTSVAAGVEVALGEAAAEVTDSVCRGAAGDAWPTPASRVPGAVSARNAKPGGP